MIKGKKREQPLQIAIQGMDGRAFKMMVMFLQGPCKGSAVVVEDVQAEAEIIDVDSANSKKLLEQRNSLHPDRPKIVLSLQQLTLEGVVFVKKPVQAALMQDAIDQIKKEIKEQEKEKEKQRKRERLQGQTSSDAQVIEEKKQLNYEEQKKTSKHKAAMALDEKGFSSYIDTMPGIDFNDPDQLASASYNAKDFFQGYVQSAYNLSRSKSRVVNLNSGLNPVTIFPHRHEVWVDSNDHQLRSFSAVPIISIAGETGQGLTITAVDPKKIKTHDLEKFQSMDAFLWKLAIWTSKGRYPHGIDIHQPVFLKHWPNFTRLTVTPHALRITALLMQGPRTLPNIAEVLNIKHQYVFVFFSAVYALGLAGQSERQADAVVAPQAIQPNKQKGLLGRIMSKLRGATNRI